MYGENARIDTLVQNETAEETETAADAFLNWVRDQEYQKYYSSTRSRRPFYNAGIEANADEWITFFDSNMGMFLRNAAIYHYPAGMVQFYKDHGNGIIPQTSIDVGTSTEFAFQLRLTPDSNADNVTGSSTDAHDISTSNVEIYGWLDVPPSNTEPYWLLVKDMHSRLVWVAAGAITHNSGVVTASPETDYALLAPDRAYVDSDLDTILGYGG